MYGSSLRRVTLRPRDSRIAAREAAAIPLPRDETTPPVTKTNLVIAISAERHVREIQIIPQTLRPLDPEAGKICSACHNATRQRATSSRGATERLSARTSSAHVR